MTKIWELDFYSRPIVDEAGKKVWEVLICESPTTINTDLASLFRFSEYCSSTEVNSVRLIQILNMAIAAAGIKPDRIRFFRQTMKNMITKACEELGIQVVLSRRTYVLNQWLQDRMQHEYVKHPSFQASVTPGMTVASTMVQPLPDALIGQKWAFVSLEASAFAEMSEWAIDFGEAFPLHLSNVQPTTPIPGLILFSQRALPMAGWMSGLELGYLKVEADPAQLLLETGGSDRWLLANLSNPQLMQEAQQFETTKQQAKGVHFLAIQKNPETEAFAGFWLLQETVLA